MKTTSHIHSSMILRSCALIWALLALMSFASPALAAASVGLERLEGVSDGQVISGSVRIYAVVNGEPSRVSFTILYPNGSRQLIVRKSWPWSLAVSNDGGIGAWNSASQPQGDYALRVRVYRGDRIVDSESIRFSVDQNASASPIIVPIAALNFATKISLTNVLPAQHTVGGDTTLQFALNNPLAKGQDVLVLAWSDKQKTMVKSFAYTISSTPYQVDGLHLDALPLGHNQVQLLLRTNNKIVSQVRHWIEVKPSVVIASAIKLSTNAPTTHQIGQQHSLDFSLNGELGQNQDVLVMAWSDARQAMVSEFSQTITAAPFTISSAMLDKLPVGRNNVQLLLRQADQTIQKVEHWIEVTEPVVLASKVAFAAGAATQYTVGSQQNIPFTLDGELGEGDDVLVLAWSDSEARMVNSFAHKVTGSPLVVAGSKMDGLPVGRCNVQLMLRHNNAVTSRSDMWLDIVPAAGSGDQSGTEPEPTTPDSGGTTEPTEPTVPDNGGTTEPTEPTTPDNGGTTEPTDPTVPDNGGTTEPTEPTVPDNGGTTEPTEPTVPDNGGTTEPTEPTVPDNGGTTEPTEPVIQVALSFDPDNPTTYTCGSDDRLLLFTEGTVPSDSALIISAASNGSVVTSFTHTIDPDSEQVSSDKLDLLPDGQNVVTAQLVSNHEILASASQVLQVIHPVEEPTPEEPTSPTIDDDGTRTTVSNLQVQAGKTYSNLIIKGGVSVVWKTINDVTFINCDFRDASVLLQVQAKDDGSSASSNWTFKNCTFKGATRSDWGHSQGTFLKGVKNFTFEDCVWEHNGWIGTTRFNQNHNVYLDSRRDADHPTWAINENVKFIRCKFIEAAAQGVKMRGFIGLQFIDCTFRGNLIDLANDTRSPGSGLIVRNCVFRDTGGTDSINLTYGWSIHLKSPASNPLESATISNCNWIGPGVSSGPGWSGTIGVLLQESGVKSVLIENPDFSQWTGEKTIRNEIGDRLRVVEGSLISPLYD
ncbi:MAG: hypothetical protein IT445_16780 [Phycisphaeraceae bacterium]|nr:hypothetical protein [Phycisphaeraceae bacterium]